jgi:hypothetical protein
VKPKGRKGKHAALFLRATLRCVRSVARLPRGRRALGSATAVGAAVAPRSRRRRSRFPLLRVRRRGFARGGGGTPRSTADWFWSIAQEREAQQRLSSGRSQGRSPSFDSSEVPHFAVSLLFLPVDPHCSSLLHLLDALIAHGLVVEQGSAHFGQPSVDGRWQRRITWPAV